MKLPKRILRLLSWRRTPQQTAQWWRHFPRTENRKYQPQPGPTDRPALQPGDVVRLRLKPALLRRVIKVEWHCHPYEFVYVIETSAKSFEPYWFFAQLEVQSPSDASDWRLTSGV